ncbi:MAG: chlorophyll synthesis pathway protein BchC [Gammaproteobacteria bacterium]|nr:chlorophyll synthesis pathway protein BchC [Gammaproteobacteria bacterium]MBU2284807.1 chlorophyll synthesis pathway protein BchC [Gammaproteobacteria bacterium]
MNTLAVVLERPEHLALSRLVLDEATDADVVVDIEWSGISTGTERLLWSGRMPQFPGMGYPLVPGYESVGRIRSAGATSGAQVGQRVFVPGAKCFGDVKGLFGGAAATVVLPGARTLAFDEALGEQGVLLALAATALHVSASADGRQPDLIIGHGVLGRMIARIAVAAGAAPVVWEKNPARSGGALGYEVVDPGADARRDYRCICDVSGDAGLLDTLISRLAPQGEVVLAGFYDQAISFAFAPAFMREARLRIASQWQPQDLVAVRSMVESGRLSLDGLITHRAEPADADNAYRTAFGDPACLKMVLDWRSCP